jgi:hypothetical protein
MESETKIRWGWLKAMYLYTIFGAGGTGLGMLLFPGAMQSSLGYPAQDPFVFSVYGCVLLAAGLIAIPALRFPLKFVPLLLLQLVYKPVWLLAIVVPHAVKGQLPHYVAFMSAVFLTYIIGDLIAIPFTYLFSRS